MKGDAHVLVLVITSGAISATNEAETMIKSLGHIGVAAYTNLRRTYMRAFPLLTWAPTDPGLSSSQSRTT